MATFILKTAVSVFLSVSLFQFFSVKKIEYKRMRINWERGCDKVLKKKRKQEVTEQSTHGQKQQI